MKATPYGPHLVQLTQTFPFPINAFLVKEEDGFTLIDTAWGQARAIVAAARALGAPIRRIALTHGHADHAGSLEALHALLPEAEVLVGRREARLMRGDRSPEAGEGQQPIGGKFVPLGFAPSRLLEPGDRVGSLEVIAAPGHSPGQLAFLDARDRSLIVGDAFQTQGGVAVAGVVRPLFPLPAWFTWNTELALQTARSLRALDPSRLAVGHGNTLENPLTAMDAAITAAEHHLGRRLSAVGR